MRKPGYRNNLNRFHMYLPSLILIRMISSPSGIKQCHEKHAVFHRRAVENPNGKTAERAVVHSHRTIHSGKFSGNRESEGILISAGNGGDGYAGKEE